MYMYMHYYFLQILILYLIHVIFLRVTSSAYSHLPSLNAPVGVHRCGNDNTHYTNHDNKHSNNTHSSNAKSNDHDSNDNKHNDKRS